MHRKNIYIYLTKYFGVLMDYSNNSNYPAWYEAKWITNWALAYLNFLKVRLTQKEVIGIMSIASKLIETSSFIPSFGKPLMYLTNMSTDESVRQVTWKLLQKSHKKFLPARSPISRKLKSRQALQRIFHIFGTFGPFPATVFSPSLSFQAWVTLSFCFLLQ